jgi:D-amino-acid oxidase
MATARELDVLVIGAGVSGLTSAICLAEAGISVRILAAEPPQQTTSAKAGASWGPYLVTDSRIRGWSTETRLALERIALAEPGSGVRLVPGIEAAPGHLEPPDWAFSVHGFRQCTVDELPDGYLSGWYYTIPLVDMPTYLTYLERRLTAAGITIEIGAVRSLDEVRHRAPVIVNCAGLGARYLVDDVELFATAGQVVVVRNPGIDRFFQDVADGEELTYVIPHDRYVILGGNAVARSEELVVDPDVTAGIIKRCTNVEPRLRDAPVLGHRVGLRPTRATVRLEREDVDGYVVVHNYGHGGAGLTLSWGCARDVQTLVAGAGGTQRVPPAP